MSDEAAAAAAPEGEGAAAEPKKPNKLVLPLVVALMTIAGGVVGVMVVAPKMIAARTHVAEGLEAEGGSEEGGEHGGGEHGGGERGPTFKIDNLIVNPSGSQGSRFLMVSVAVETADGKMEELLRGREAQIRDVVIAMLERKTMDDLSVTGIRDSIKAELSDTITAIAGMKTKLRVFLPQFVIQ
ncbi:MAG: flagellar basal body-associated protein FliL [Gemmatimonadales bacterium]